MGISDFITQWDDGIGVLWLEDVSYLGDLCNSGPENLDFQNIGVPSSQTRTGQRHYRSISCQQGLFPLHNLLKMFQELFSGCCVKYLEMKDEQNFLFSFQYSYSFSYTENKTNKEPLQSLFIQVLYKSLNNQSSKSRTDAPRTMNLDKWLNHSVAWFSS
jgi:hypothetical protein